LAQLEEKYGDDLLLITQNIDDLHQRAGSKNVLPMHGELLKVRCLGAEEHIFDCTENQPDICQKCAAKMRPHIVWFGEIPFFMDKIQKALSSCSIFAYIGTSSKVYPAAGFKQIAKQNGAKVFCLNLETEIDRYTDEYHKGKASEIVPRWIETL
jgi:NAD-dependent deacetylase